MTLVYAKIINMCGAGPETGGWGQGVGVKGGQGGVWNSSQVTAAHILLWVGMWGCGGGAMMGAGMVMGKGGVERLLLKFWTKQVSLLSIRVS